MKQYLTKLICLFFFLGFSITQSYAQQSTLFSNVRSALKAGSSKELAKYFHETVELNINGESDNYSNAHAEIYLKDFFKKYEPVDFEYAHQGSSSEGLQYAIGNYSYSGGNFRVLIRTKKFSGTDKIYIIDFLKE
ncbi:DUF4783 domain-containing protein [Marivirga sp. S37H4]|uniref:DUF4783 domain-containing protein n=1 Tax=Marivirga aurantiaca TaxID=2802615 RepID=A0A934WZB6_9BACT|nr:DUF4783 domain-containing protein [Marivirga aurantiaca]MBK6265671.1 DUF4783 domain-containing protein [Marivirga aurantiaca]